MLEHGPHNPRSCSSIKQVTNINFNFHEILIHIRHSEKVLNMRIFLSLIVLIIGLQSWTKADDISDFEIEGMSLGDSALNFFTKSEIDKSVEEMPQYPNDEYKIAYIQKSKKYNFENYQGITFYFKKNDRSYKIAGIVASNYYPNDFQNCLNDLKKMRKDIENSFDVLPIYEGEDILEFDTFGKTKMHGVVYDLAENGFSQVVCYDWSKEISKIQGRIDELTMGISTKEYGEWLNVNSN